MHLNFQIRVWCDNRFVWRKGALKLAHWFEANAAPNNSFNPTRLSVPFINLVACDGDEYHRRATG